MAPEPLHPCCCQQKLESKQSLHCKPAAPQNPYHEVGLGPEPPNPVYQNLLCVAAASKNLTATELGGKAEGQHGAGCDAMQGINSALLGKAWSTGFLASLPPHAKPKLHATESLLNWALNKSISHSPACPSTLSVTAHWAAISISRGLSFKGSYWHLTVIGADRATVGGCPRGAQIPAGSTPQCCTPSGAPGCRTACCANDHNKSLMTLGWFSPSCSDVPWWNKRQYCQLQGNISHL